MTISAAKIEVKVTSTLLSAQDFGGGHNASDPLAWSNRTSYTNGTGANKAEHHWHDKRTLSSGANDDLDLSGGITDAFGATVSFTKIKALYIRNRSTTDGLTIGDAAAGEWIGSNHPFATTGHTLFIPPGGELLLNVPTAAGYTIANGTDTLRIAHDGTTSADADYDIAVVGETS